MSCTSASWSSQKTGSWTAAAVPWAVRKPLRWVGAALRLFVHAGHLTLSASSRVQLFQDFENWRAGTMGFQVDQALLQGTLVRFVSFRVGRAYGRAWV